MIFKRVSSWRAKRRTIKELTSWEGRTGWPESATYEDGTKAADAAEWNEYGTSTIPPRPFVRQAVRSNRSKWEKQIASDVQKCIDGKLKPEQVFGRVAMIAAGDIATSISKGDFVPLSPATLRSRQSKVAGSNFSTKPLVDTGLMLQSVTGISQRKG